MRETVCSEPECRAPLVPGGQATAPLFAQRPFTNLCFVCALAIYIERLASFALKGPPPPLPQYKPIDDEIEKHDRELVGRPDPFEALWLSILELQRKVEEERRRMNP
jgi:hypothetical protein